MLHANEKKPGKLVKANATRPFSVMLVSPQAIWHLVAFSLFINILMLTGPVYMLQVYDRVLSSQSVPTLFALTLLIILLYSAFGVLEWVRSAMLETVGAAFENEHAPRALQVVRSIAVSDPDKPSDRLIQDIRNIRRFLAGPVPTAILDAPWTPVFLLALFLLHPAFGGFAIIGGLILVTFGFVNHKVTSDPAARSDTVEREAASRLHEMVSLAQTSRGLGMEPALEARWKSRFDLSGNLHSRASLFISAFAAVTKSFRLFLQSAVLGLGALLFIEGETSVGSMVAASILLGRAIAPVEQIVGQWRTIAAARSAWINISSKLERGASVPTQTSLMPLKGHVRAESVFYTPPGEKRPTLRNISFEVLPGDIVGVIGKSASGKSTLARLLAGILVPVSGSIRFDGAETNQFSSAGFGKQIGYLPQRVDLFEGTVRDNISRFDPEATDQKVIEAALMAGCHEVILELEKGYDTSVGPGGAGLSAGQSQRIALARALFGKPRVIVLDEPNSNLDAAGDTALQRAIQAMQRSSVTVFIIAHRPSILSQCTSIMVLDGGRLSTFGPAAKVLSSLVRNRSANDAKMFDVGSTRDE